MPRAKRRWPALVAALLLSIFTTVSAPPTAAVADTKPPQSTPTSRVDAIIRPSLLFVFIKATGTVVVPYTDGSTQQFDIEADASCSGAIVSSSGTDLTAGHCVDPDEYAAALIDNEFADLQKKGLTGSLTVEDAEANWSVTKPTLDIQVYPLVASANVATSAAMTARVLPGSETFDNGDVALLQTNPSGPQPALSIAPAVPAVGTDIVTAGYPGAINDTVDIENLQPTLSPGQTTSVQTVKAAKFIGVSSTLTSGDSGGPTVDMQGRIIGTNSWNPTDQSQQLNFVTSTTEVRKLLAENQVPLQLDATDRAWRAGLADYFAGHYHAAVAQFNIVLTAIPDDVSAQQYAAKAKAGFALETSGTPWWVYGLIALVVLLAVAAAIYRIRRRQRGRIEDAPDARIQDEPVARRAGDLDARTEDDPDATNPRMKRPDFTPPPPRATDQNKGWPRGKYQG
jgi:serine protease Do